jgi:hypothetical protein
VPAVRRVFRRTNPLASKRQFYRDQARTLPYYFTTGECPHMEFHSVEGISRLEYCDVPVVQDARITLPGYFLTGNSRPVILLSCDDHLNINTNRCPCPLPIDGQRCMNQRASGEHYCSQNDDVQNCGAWYNDPANPYPDQFSPPNNRLFDVEDSDD